MNNNIIYLDDYRAKKADTGLINRSFNVEKVVKGVIAHEWLNKDDTFEKYFKLWRQAGYVVQ